jgi:hypothetical protein
MSHEHAGHRSAEDEYRSTPAGAGHEHTDAHVSAIVKFILWLAVIAVVVHFGLAFMYEFLIRQSMPAGEPQYPRATREVALPPAPRLQQFPANDIYRFRLGERSLLESYGWINKNDGIVHIPIEEAMRITVERGLPFAPDSQVPPESVGQPMPADSSSGRTLVQRRQ